MSIYVYIHAIYQKKLHETDRLVSKCSMKNLDEQWSKPTYDIQILCCSWRDPYTGFLKSLYKWVVNFIPYFVPAQLGWNIATHVWWRKLRKNHSFLQMCKTSLTRKTRTEIIDVQLQSVKSGGSPARFGAPNHKKQKKYKKLTTNLKTGGHFLTPPQTSCGGHPSIFFQATFEHQLDSLRNGCSLHPWKSR